MLELFFDSSGIVYIEFIPEGATVNKHRYKEILRRLRKSVHRNRPELWRRKNWLLLRGNAPAHRSVLVQEELANNRSPFCHNLHTHLISYHAISFSFPTRKKATWASISVDRGDRHCHKGNRTGPFSIYLSAVFLAVIPTLADLHSYQRRLFRGRLWCKCM
jgi:hypothetical protein